MNWLRRYPGDLRDCFFLITEGLVGGAFVALLWDATHEKRFLLWLAERWLGL